MEIWFKIIYIYTISTVTLQQEEGPCTLTKNPLGAQQYTCKNITSLYLQTNGIELNRSAWFACESCNLSAITSSTFNFCKNNVAYINLTYNMITNIQGFAFAKFPLLKLLILKNNSISKLSDNSFCSIYNLLQLDVSNNQIAKLQDDIFAELTNLDLLNLNYNKIETIEPKAFNNLTALKYLYLNNNEITFIHPYLFKHMEELKILYIENNKIKEINNLAFTNLRNLQFLYLSNNCLELLIEYNFKLLPSLIDLQLRNNSLTQIQISCFNGLKNLKFLYLGNNKISHIDRLGFVGLDSLLVLDLIGNNLTTFTFDTLEDTPHLTALWLENNALSNLNITRTTKMHSNLKNLDLKHNHLTFFNYKILLKKMVGLNELVLGGNDWRCEFFVPMQDFFEDTNISLCLDYSCDSNKTVYYTENLCKLSLNETITESNANVLTTFNCLLLVLYSLCVSL